MNFQHIYKSKVFRNAVIIIASLSVALAIFEGGIAVGYRKAAFSYRSGEGYYRMFFGSREGVSRNMMGFLGGDDMYGGHGANGKVVKTSPVSVVLSSPDNTERVVTISGNTIVRRFRDVASTSDIKVDDFIVVLGSPDDVGQVNAKFIRIIPPASTTGMGGKMMYFR